MVDRHRTRPALSEVLHVVLDDATVERLRLGARHRGVELEQLIVHVIHAASWRLDDVLDG